MKIQVVTLCCTTVSRKQKMSSITKTTKLILFCFCLLSLLFTNNAKAIFGLHLDAHGKIIFPDQYYLGRGLDNYNKGYLNHAKSLIRRSARYGNHAAMYYLARIHFEEKNWPYGYAWIKLAEPRITQAQKLKREMEPLLSPDEKQRSETIYLELKKKFNEQAGLKQRKKWKRNIRLVGTHIGGNKPIGGLRLDNIATRNRTTFAQNVDGDIIFDSINDYVLNYYEHYGLVYLTDLKMIDDN